MSILKSITSIFSAKSDPVAKQRSHIAMRRAPEGKQFMTGERDFYAGKIDRLSNAFKGSGLSINEALKGSLQVMRHRCRELYKDNDYGKKFIAMCKGNVVGSKGIRLQSRCVDMRGNPDQMDRTALETAWKDFCKRGICSSNGRMSMLDIQRLAISTIGMEGEVLIRVVYRNVYKYGIAFQFIDNDRLDTELNKKKLENGNRIVMSVELDPFDKPVAYYILVDHPSDAAYSFNNRKYMRVPADEIIHRYIDEFVDQVRGIPWMHASARRLDMIGGYEEAELVAARAGASKMGFYYSDPEDGGTYSGDDVMADGTLVQEVEPGAIEQLPNGVKFQEYDPQHPTGAFNYFMRGILRGAAAGLNVSYTGYTGDLEAVNYSSIRAGLIEERENWRVIQGWFVEHIMAAMFEKWLVMALTRGMIVNQAGVKLPISKIDKFSVVSWRARGWAWVDPLKDQQANDAAVAAGHKTNTECISERGEDIEDVYEMLAYEQTLREKYGLEPKPVPPAEKEKQNADETDDENEDETDDEKEND